MSRNDTAREWLSNHPRTTSALWALVLLWATTGSAIASTAGGSSGP